ncbi:MAG TPA: hypothetical protein PKH77_16120 [Anaerolineae bacterium]|nr:hypothetical protein [Anaerolineae bacterium]
MSVDLDILSTSPTVICWNDVKDRLKELLGPLASVLGENSVPVILRTHEALNPDKPFSFEDSYGLNLEIQNTLGIHVWSNVKYPIERDYLEDYGRNLSLEVVEDLLDRCRSAGHHYGIGSFAGRGPHEFQIMAALAVAIAEACQGYVVLMNDGIFDLATGIYAPEQFRQARLL